uniref:Uncharacterized protein n=1 Tax=Clastoptera arizonana TaxID=38151 RepID=A0A1B6ECD7_9HEMI
MKPNTSYYHKLPRKVCKKIYFLFAIFILGWIIIIFTINQSKVGVSRSFSMKEAMVPNIVHFIIFNKNTINFVTFLCISAALKILIGRKDARFLNLWLQGYKRYKPSMWYYNAGQYPTEQILVHNPDIFHRVPLLFGVHNLADKLYMQVEWPEWKTYFSLHLLSRHPPAPSFINETTILNDSTVFSEIATWSLFHLGPKLDVLHNEWVDIS